LMVGESWVGVEATTGTMDRTGVER